jgi:hypothetical protein
MDSAPLGRMLKTPPSRLAKRPVVRPQAGKCIIASVDTLGVIKGVEKAFS